MPITGPSSYLGTLDEFLTHWGAADTELGAGNEIVFPNGTNRAALVTLRATLVTKRNDVQVKLNAKELGRGDVEEKKAALLERLQQLLDRVRGAYPGSKWERALPNQPGQGEGESSITDALDDADNIWAEINADPATVTPLKLVGGFTRTQFRTAIDALKTAYKTLNDSETTLKITLERRNDVQDEIYEILKNYRKVFPSYFAKGHALIDSLPRLSPEPGSTPDAVTANGSYDATQQKARLNSTESTDPNLFQIEWRYCSGSTYSTDLEAVVPGGSIPPGGNREIFTDIALSSPGAVATFRAYVITTTGNEKGSNTITITRP